MNFTPKPREDLRKMKKFCFILLIFLLLFSESLYAVEFRSYKIVAEIRGDEVEEELLINLFNDGSTDLNTAFISAPLDSEVIAVSDSYGDLQYQISTKRGTKIDFNFTIPVKPLEERLLRIRLKTKSLVTRRNDYFEYLLVFTPKQDLSDFEHVLKLPKDARLYSPGKSFQMVVPEAELSQEKEAPILRWKTELKANEPEVFLVRFKSEHDQIWIKIFIILGTLFLIFVLGFSGNKIWKRHQKVRTIKSFKILNERERRVLEEIVKNEGIKQYELLEKLGYTKASLSKILSKLESRGLIKKKKVGKINKLYSGDKIG